MANKPNLDKQKERAMQALIDLMNANTYKASVKHKNLLIKIYNSEVDELNKLINSKSNNNED